MSIDDRRLDELLADAARTYRVPPEAPLDGIWAGVEMELQDAARRRRAPGWGGVAIAASVALMVGMFSGRAIAPTRVEVAVVPAVDSAVNGRDPNSRATVDLLGRTAVLLAGLNTTSGAANGDHRLADEGARLLTTTRLLIDSPVGQDQQLRSLLQDLELILVQVARLPVERAPQELRFIESAVDEHDIVPRLASAVADYSVGTF